MLAVLLCCLLAAWPSTAQSETRANFTGQELYDLTSRFLDALMYPDDVEQVRLRAVFVCKQPNTDPHCHELIWTPAPRALEDQHPRI